MLGKRLEDLTLADIEDLVTNQVAESRSLDFKRDAIGARDADKKEFLADVSAFANTIGGDLLLGVDEESGVATDVPGIVLENLDEEIRRLDSIVRSGLEPRLPKFELRWLPQQDGRGVMVVRVPRSWAGPHRVVFANSARFYGRNSASKFEMDVAELRAAFMGADEPVQRIRRFRTERLAEVESGNAPLPMPNGPKLTLHIVPLASLTSPISIDVQERGRILAPPLAGRGFNPRVCLEGLISSYDGSSMLSLSYALLFRNGIIEAVASLGVSEDQEISSQSFRDLVFEALPEYIEALRWYAIEAPVYVMVSLTGVRGCLLDGKIGWRDMPLNRDVIVCPEVVLDNVQVERDTLTGMFKPTLNLLRNAFGRTGCY